MPIHASDSVGATAGSTGPVTAAPLATAPVPAGPMPAGPIPTEPMTAATSAPPPTSRPDPYTQIANPLHTGWGTTPVAAPEPPPTQLTIKRKRSPWLRRGILLLVMALLGVGLWSQRDRIEEKVDDLTNDTESSLVSPS